MNIVQAQVAHAVAAHFRREDRLMPRNGPVELFDKDQQTFVNDLVKIFSYQNNLFNEKDFRNIIFGGGE